MKKHSKICLVTESKSKPVTSNFVGPWDANTRSSGCATSPKSVTCCDRRCLPWFEVHTLHLLQLFKIKKKKDLPKAWCWVAELSVWPVALSGQDILQVSLDSQVPGCVEVQAVTPAVPFSPVFLCGYFEVNLFSKP